MANGNPFAVTPAGNLQQPLSGLSSVLGQVGEQRMIRQQAEQEQADQRERQASIAGALRSGDPEEMARVSALYPEAARGMEASLGIREDFQRDDLKSFLTNVLSNPENAEQMYRQRIQRLQDEGRDPSQTVNSFDLYQQDPELAMRGNQMMLADIAPDSYRAWKDSTAQMDPQDRDIVQVYPAQGEPYSAQTDGSGNYFDMTGQPLSLGRADRVVESSQLSGTAESMGLTQKEKENLDSTIISTRNFSDTVDDALQMIEDRPDLNTLTARGAALVNDLQTEIQAMGNAFGFDFDESMLDPSEHADVFDDMGIQNARMRSLVTNLAFARAQANNPDGRISNADFRAAVSEIGGAASDPRAFSQVLKDVRDRSIRSFETMYRVKTGEPYSGMPLMREGGPRGEQQGGQQGGGYGEGQTATNPQTGEQLIFRDGEWVPNNG